MDDLISRQAAIDALFWLYEYQRDIDPTEAADLVRQGIYLAEKKIEQLPSAQPDITDEQAIGHLQASGWMQNHDKQMYEMGLREHLANDNDSYDALLPSAQPERKWIPCSNPPKHHKDVIVRGIEAIGNVTVHKVMQWDVDTWRPTDYAPSIIWKEWSEI